MTELTISIDCINKRLFLYRMNNCNNNIWSVDYNGNEKKTIVQSNLHIEAVSVFGNRLYLHKHNSSLIHEMNVTSENIYRNISLPKQWSRLVDIVVVDNLSLKKTEGCPSFPCGTNAYCSNINGTRSCQCHKGFASWNGSFCKDVKSCAELKSSTGTTTDGEYQLPLKFPSSKKAVSVYCADMNTTSPKEYITLKGSNYATNDYTIGAAINNKDKPSSKTLFEKIRILQDLTVVTNDYRFAKVDWFTWNKTFAPYGSGKDCSSYLCYGSKYGKFRMDLTDTGFIFRTPIMWKSLGWPTTCYSRSPYDYSEVNKKVVSGNCGGYCGRCSAQNLQVDVEVSCSSDD